MAAEADDAVRGLVAVGWTETEARVYCALLRNPRATGYELARESGLARANVYEALARLERRGAAARQDQGGVLRYEAVPFGQLARRVVEDIQEVVADAEEALARMKPALGTERTGVGVVVGERPVWNLARSLAAGAERALRLAQSGQDAGRLVADVDRALERGAVVTTLCLDGCRVPCDHCRGAVYRGGGERLPAATLFLAQDDRAALWCRVRKPAEREPVAVYATDPAFVAWLRAAYDNSIAAGQPMTKNGGDDA